MDNRKKDVPTTYCNRIQAMMAYFIINKDIYNDKAKVLVTLNKMSNGRGATFAKG